MTSVQTPWNAGSFVLTEHRTRRVGGASQPSESSEGCRLHTLERIERRKGSPVQQAVRPRRHTDQADLWTVPMCACPGPSTQREVGKCTRSCSEVLELGSPLVPPRGGAALVKLASRPASLPTQSWLLVVAQARIRSPRLANELYAPASNRRPCPEGRGRGGGGGLNCTQRWPGCTSERRGRSEEQGYSTAFIAIQG